MCPTGSDLVVRLAVLSDDPDPGEHVVPVLGLEQVLTEVLGGQPQSVLTLGFAVGDVNQATADADWRMLVLAWAGPRPMKDGCPLVLVEEERMGSQYGENTLPGPHAAADFLE